MARRRVEEVSIMGKIVINITEEALRLLDPRALVALKREAEKDVDAQVYVYIRLHREAPQVTCGMEKDGKSWVAGIMLARDPGSNVIHDLAYGLGQVVYRVAERNSHPVWRRELAAWMWAEKVLLGIFCPDYAVGRIMAVVAEGGFDDLLGDLPGMETEDPYLRWFYRLGGRRRLVAYREGGSVYDLPLLAEEIEEMFVS